MTTKLKNRLVEKFLGEVESFLHDLSPELRSDILREVRENLEARAMDLQEELSLPNSFEYANELREAAGLQPLKAKGGLFKNVIEQLISSLKANRFALAVAKFLRPFATTFLDCDWDQQLWLYPALRFG